MSTCTCHVPQPSLEANDLDDAPHRLLTAQLPLSSGSSPLRSRATVAAAPALLARFLDAAALSPLMRVRSMTI
eukprot:4989155-Prymnesium_polylepis.1